MDLLQKTEHIIIAVGKFLGTKKIPTIAMAMPSFNFASKSKAVRNTCAGTAGLVECQNQGRWSWAHCDHGGAKT